MAPTIEDIEKRLNHLYQTNPKEYIEHLNMIKGLGYKIYRNPKGIHKVKMDWSSAFGGVFTNIFK